MHWHEIEYIVQFDDCNAFGHIGNSRWMDILERSRITVMSRLGYPMGRFFKEGVSALVSKAEIAYLMPVGVDESLAIQIRPEEVDGQLVLHYRARSAQTTKPALRARLELRFVAKDGSMLSVPTALKQVLFGEG
jgi:acyl-CoA thioesterase FadM